MTDALLQAEQRCREARSIEALAFTMANETWQVLQYRQAQVWVDRLTGPELLAVSGLATLPEDSPFTVWVKRLVGQLWSAIGKDVVVIDLAALESGTADANTSGLLTRERVSGWQEWWPPYLMVVPMRDGDSLLGAALILLEQPPTSTEMATLLRLQQTWTYCAWALTRASQRKRSLLQAVGRRRWVIAAVLAVVMLIPVRQSVLAPAEIVALEAIAVSAPIEGVVSTLHVQPNQMVSAGQPLFSLDDTTLRNRREIAARALDVAAAELLTAQQKAFNDDKARDEVAILQNRLAERRAELRAVEAQLGRTEVVAPRDGIAVFGDINDWQGRPVVIGERVMQIADPRDAGVLVYLPVADAITLETGSVLRLFLHAAPLSPLSAKLTETSYQSVLSPDGIASYRLRGTFDDDSADAVRIGLTGTAKVYGESVALIYYVLRRPLAHLRQWSGM